MQNKLRTVARALLLGVLGVTFCMVAFGIVPVARAQAAGAPAAWGLPQLMQSLSQVKSSRAHFVERKYLSIVNTPLEYTGGLAYTAPDRLEKRTETPKAESMILEGERLTLENARKQRRVVMLSEYPVVRAFVESIRSTLGGDLQTLNRYYRVSLEGQPGAWQLLLVPSEPSMQAVVREIRIEGADTHLKSIEIIEKEGDRSVMRITEVAP